jgi:dTDP-4-amino-4,6-dideoxygalactose transaminase
VAAALVPDSSAILSVHTFGVPSDVDSLAELGRGYGIPVVVDAAHAFGSRYPDGSAVGSKGLAEVFSLSPTKPLSAGEGGLVTTHDGRLAGRLRLAREYGNAGDYDSRLVGLNGRMTEMQALLGRANLRHFPDRLAGRQRLVERYRKNLTGLPGVGFQEVPRGASSVYKDFAISVDPTGFGLSRDQLARCLAVENVATRPYFCPPVHRQTAYREVRPTVPLDTSERLAVSLLTLPLYSHMEVDLVDGISEAVASIQAHAEQIAARPAG